MSLVKFCFFFSPGNVPSRQPEPVARSQERLVYNVGPPPRKSRREHKPPSGQYSTHMVPVQSFANHTLIPTNDSSQPRGLLSSTPHSHGLLSSTPHSHGLLSTPVHVTHPRPPASIPISVYNQYPPGLGYPTNISPVAAVHPGAVPRPLVSRNVPYSRSNSYPMHYAEQMVTPQPLMQYSSVLPQSVHKSPPYRQIRQPVTLQHPVANTSNPRFSYDGSHPYPLGHNPQVLYRPGNPEVLTRHEAVSPAVSSPSQSHDPSKHRQRGK